MPRSLALEPSTFEFVGPIYVCFGLGLGLFFVTQGVGRAVVAMNANAVRLVVRTRNYWFLCSGRCGLLSLRSDTCLRGT
jgi:hypothetical protein